MEIFEGPLQCPKGISTACEAEFYFQKAHYVQKGNFVCVTEWEGCINTKSDDKYHL